LIMTKEYGRSLGDVKTAHGEVEARVFA